MTKITIVEDVVQIREELRDFLVSQGYEVAIISEFRDVAKQVMDSNCSCVLLDLNLPNEDGHFICKEIRKKSNVAILVVTSRNSDVDELMSLNLGADGFISKPYHLQVLLAYIQRLIERYSDIKPQAIVECHGIELNLANSTLSFQKQKVELTKNEVKIADYLFRNVGIIISRDDLAEHMWNQSMYVDENALSVNVNRLRKKLALIGFEDLIQTKWGLGYIINETL